MATIYHTADIFRELERRCAQDGMRRTARQLGFDYKFVHDVLHHKRTLTARLARALGFVALPQQYVRAEDYPRLRRDTPPERAGP
jgi:hypothetical protein